MMSMATRPPAATGISSTVTGFEAFFRDEYPRLAKAMFLLSGDRAEAEELAQESLARVYERWARIESMESPDGYLYRVALNLYRRRFRRATPWQQPTQPEDPAVTVTARAEIRRALRTVTKEQREALVLVEWLGLDAQEAGDLLGIDPASVRTRLHRARTALRKEADSDE